MAVWPGAGDISSVHLRSHSELPISMVRSGLQGLPLSDRLSSGDVVYSVIWCVVALAVGSLIFKRFEGEAVKHL